MAVCDKGIQVCRAHFVVAELPSPDRAQDLELTRLSSDVLGVCCRSGHPLAAAGPVAMERLLDYPWIMPPSGTRAQARLNALFVGANLPPPRPAVESESLALLLQMLHPAVLAGVWDHSDFRADMHGRLRRTAKFIATTTYDHADNGRAMIDKVNRIHARLAGVLPDGTPSELTVSATLRERGQIRDVSTQALSDLKALEQRAEDRLERSKSGEGTQ